MMDGTYDHGRTNPATGTVEPVLAGRVLAAHLARAKISIGYFDRAEGRTHTLPIAAAREPDGLLPVFAVAGEAVWREATGKSWALDIRPDGNALLGRRLHAIGGVSYQVLLLTMMEAAHQATGPAGLLVNHLRTHWAASFDRLPAPGLDSKAGRAAAPGASP